MRTARGLSHLKKIKQTASHSANTFHCRHERSGNEEQHRGKMSKLQQQQERQRQAWRGFFRKLESVPLQRQQEQMYCIELFKFQVFKMKKKLKECS